MIAKANLAELAAGKYESELGKYGIRLLELDYF